MNNKKTYRHMFTREGRYIGCREITAFDIVKPYLFSVFGILGLIGFIYVCIHDTNINVSIRWSPQTQSVLEVPSR